MSLSPPLKPHHHDLYFPIAVWNFLLTNQQKVDEVCTKAFWLQLSELPWSLKCLRVSTT